VSFDRVMRVAWLLVVVYAIFVVQQKHWLSGTVGVSVEGSTSTLSEPIKLQLEK
jgi:hypothetical protein